ncbi:MAG: hypothetical protein ABL907_17470 [Hyphomicrobium sp.]
MMSVSKSGLAQLAVLAALGIFTGGMTSAQAADLGGNCCADLEERIAELEATTARKGNRKVSLEISGHINEAVLYWDDGVESNVGTYTNDNARSRFRLKGEAKINGDWKAGYLMEWGVRTQNSKRFNQDDPKGDGAGQLDLRHQVWYLNSKTFGRVWMGLTGGASEGVTETNLAATKDILKYSDQEDNGLGLNMLINGASTGVAWRRLIRGGGDQPGEGRRHNLVRYDTPEFAGFHATANWGEDDAWEVGLRYKGEFGDFKLAAAIAYGEQVDNVAEPFQCVGNDTNDSADCQQLGGSVSVMHAPTGIYVNFAAGYLDDNQIATDPGAAGIAAVVDDRSSFYAGEVGIEQKWNELGKTTVFGQYYHNSGGSQDRSFNGGDIVSSELQSFGVGVVQGIDAAAMHVYLTYRHYQGDVTSGAALVNTDIDDLDVVMGGAIIRF